MTTYIRFILNNRILVISIFLGITIFFGYFMSKATIRSSPEELFFGDHPGYKHYQQRCLEFGGDRFVLIGFQGIDLLLPESLARIERVVETIESIPEVIRVVSLASVQHIDSLDNELYIDYYKNLLTEKPELKPALLKELVTDPMTKDLLVSSDGRHSVLLIEFDTDKRVMETTPDKIKTIIETFVEEGFDSNELHQAGLIAIMAEVVHQSLLNLRQILPVTVVILLVSVYIMFKRLWPVILTFILTLTAVIWTMGLAIILYDHINIFTTVIPGLIMITCFADVIHLCSAYLLELSAGADKDQAIMAVGKEVGTACGYTSLTTFFGFMGMTFVPTPIFRQLGFLMAFGVSAALFMAMTLVPVFLSFMPRPDIWKHGRSFIVQDIIDLILDKTASLTIRFPRTMVVIFCLIFIIASYGFSQIRFETQFSKRFDENNIVQVSKRYFERHFPGTNPLDIYIESPEKQGLLNPELFAEIAKFEAWIENLDSVKQVVSVVDLVKKMYQEIAPEQAEANPLPVTREALAQLLLLFEMSGGENLDRMIDYEYKITRLNVRLPDMGVIETSQIGKRIAEHGKKLFDGAAIVESLSMDYLLGDWVDDVLKGQRTGLLFAMMTVAILMIISMRSFQIGLISMFPNLLPLLVLLGYMGLCWDEVDTDTLGILMIAIGIGVDDTVHFLMRLRFEFEKTHDVEHAIRKTFHYSGRAIFITSVILVAGFAPFAMSEYFSLHIFGTLLPACLLVALAADLFLVPALVCLGWVRFPRMNMNC